MADDHPAAVLAGLIAEATEGPWEVRLGAHGYDIYEDGNQFVTCRYGEDDARLIVHLVNHAPKVVDLITAAEKGSHDMIEARCDGRGCQSHRVAAALRAALAALTVTPAGEGPGPT